MGLKLQLCLALLASFSLAVLSQELRADAGPMEERGKEEIEFGDGEEQDLKFDATILDSEGRPEARPQAEEVEKVYRENLDSLKKDAEAVGDVEAFEVEQSSRVSINLNAQFFTRPVWYGNYKQCCPASQNYDCRSNQYKLGCFYHYVNGRREYCCPFWGLNNYISNCNCGKCHRLTKDCVYQGRCLRRYSWRVVYAVCYRQWWGICRRIKMYLPTSCYCRINKYQPYCQLQAYNSLAKL